MWEALDWSLSAAVVDEDDGDGDVEADEDAGDAELVAEGEDVADAGEEVEDT